MKIINKNIHDIRKSKQNKKRPSPSQPSTKTYINKYCELDDLAELKQLIDAKEKELQGE
ncbi:hypothetical protein ABFY60_15450 [Lysinibacillus pakistanensis]|uniref:hypothetical protein n=1 Tax=Lysinibacillus pakistanensis TaxID=759811 RepID=UPI003D2D9C5F